MYESATSSKEEEMSVEVFSSEIVKDLMALEQNVGLAHRGSRGRWFESSPPDQ
jgi:hypothetical protein